MNILFEFTDPQAKSESEMKLIEVGVYGFIIILWIYFSESFILQSFKLSSELELIKMSVF